MDTAKQQELIEQASKQGKQRLFVLFHHSHALKSLFKEKWMSHFQSLHSNEPLNE